MTNEAADDNISELHVVIHEASDNADAEIQIKWSHVSKQQELMRDRLTNINYHEKDSMLTWQETDNVELSACDDQHQTNFYWEAVHVWLSEKD